MNIYLLTHNNGSCYGDYVSCVVIAKSAPDARLMHPSGAIYNPKIDYKHPDYNEELDNKTSRYNRYDTGDWCHPDQVIVSLIGRTVEESFMRKVCNFILRKKIVTDPDLKAGTVVCANNIGS